AIPPAIRGGDYRGDVVVAGRLVHADADAGALLLAAHGQLRRDLAASALRSRVGRGLRSTRAPIRTPAGLVSAQAVASHRNWPGELRGRNWCAGVRLHRTRLLSQR